MINLTGNVGIGTTGPVKKLNVVGDINSTGSYYGDGSQLTGIVSIPSGAVMFFKLSSCPSGWSQDTAAVGRVIVGTNTSGTINGTVGTALLNLSPRNITDVPAHTHAVDPPNTSVSITDPGHGHNIAYKRPDANTNTDPINQISITENTSPSHDHQWDYPSGHAVAEQIVYVGTHRLGASPRATGITASVDIGSFTSGSTGSASVDVTMPFIQYLVCVKN